ncbi:Ig-like domain-containing protein [Staphylococcus rostri]
MTNDEPVDNTTENNQTAETTTNETATNDTASTVEEAVPTNEVTTEANTAEEAATNEESTTNEEVAPTSEEVAKPEATAESTSEEAPVTEEVEAKAEETVEPVSQPTITARSANTEPATSGTAFRSVGDTATPSDATGQLVNDKVIMSSFNLERKPFYPNSGESLNFSGAFKVEGNVRENDYFTFVLPENLSLNGDVDFTNVGSISSLPDLYSREGQLVAKGYYNEENKTGTYVFTDYVNDKDNITGDFTLPIFADRESSPMNGTYNVEFNMANTRYVGDVIIDYGNPAQGNEYGANITSTITGIDISSGQNEYEQTIYVNPMERNLKNTKVTIQGYHDDATQSSTVINKDLTNIKVYEVVNGEKITDSYFVDTTNPNFVDVTKDVLPYVTYNNDN